MTDLIPAARPVPSPEDRMADARTDTPHTFRTYLDATERDQLDALQRLRAVLGSVATRTGADRW